MYFARYPKCQAATPAPMSRSSTTKMMIETGTAYTYLAFLILLLITRRQSLAALALVLLLALWQWLVTYSPVVTATTASVQPRVDVEPAHGALKSFGFFGQQLVHRHQLSAAHIETLAAPSAYRFFCWE